MICRIPINYFHQKFALSDQIKIRSSLLALHVSSDTHVDTSLPPLFVKAPHLSWCNECEEDTSCIKYFLAKLKLQKTKLSDSLFGHDLSSF